MATRSVNSLLIKMMIKLKSPELSGLFNSLGAGGRTRTDMGRESPLDFESSAYTNFATPAFSTRLSKAIAYNFYSFFSNQ
mgnify:CR=1 FL=1